MTDYYGLEPESVGSEGWEINIESKPIKYLRGMNAKISDHEFNRVIRSACRILSNCPNPKGRLEHNTGLVVGRVQSGKTLSFTSLIGLASTNGYGLIIVLGGTKDTLVRQTYERLIKDLGIMQSGGSNNIYIQINPTINISDSLNSIIAGGRCPLLVVLKHRQHLENLRDLVATISQVPTLIIDDEGDEASLNTYFRRGRESSTYRLIREIESPLHKYAYIAYTATPQANLLLSDIDNLHPTFCELIEPGIGYCGGSVFFGKQGNRYIRIINDVDGNVVEDGAQIPDSLKQALAIFFVSAAIRHLRSEFQKHTMLIHMTQRTTPHTRTFDSVSGLITNWKAQLSLMPADPSRQSLIGLFKAAYDDMIGTVTFNPPSWEAVQQRLPKELTFCQCHMVNSLLGSTRLEERTFQLENNIVIGGNILGRGLTIPQLTISYMARRAQGRTNADTLEQRARWFGYKSDYIDLCRIFIPQRVRSDYEGLLVHEDDFWSSLRRNIAQGAPLNKWPRMLRLNAELGVNPTRASVASFHRFRPGWKTQTRPVNDPQIVESNINIVNEFFASHGADDVRWGSTTRGTAHKIIRDCPLHEVVELMGHIATTPSNTWDMSYLIEYLERLNLHNVLESADIVLMHGGTLRERNVIGGRIDELMQGQYPQGPNPTYPGDRNIHNGRVQLQIHYVQCQVEKENVSKTTALALYIPEDEGFDLSFVVRGEEE